MEAERDPGRRLVCSRLLPLSFLRLFRDFAGLFAEGALSPGGGGIGIIWGVRGQGSVGPRNLPGEGRGGGVQCLAPQALG